VLLEGSHEGGRKNFFRFDLVAGHVEGEGESPMTVTLIDVALFLFTGLLGSLGEHGVRRDFAFEFEQVHPDVQAISPGIRKLCLNRSLKSEYSSLAPRERIRAARTWHRAGNEQRMCQITPSVLR
jgi:hypothetical protein